jgi:hypothetical protein
VVRPAPRFVKVLEEDAYARGAVVRRGAGVVRSPGTIAARAAPAALIARDILHNAAEIFKGRRGRSLTPEMFTPPPTSQKTSIKDERSEHTLLRSTQGPDGSPETGHQATSLRRPRASRTVFLTCEARRDLSSRVRQKNDAEADKRPKTWTRDPPKSLPRPQKAPTSPSQHLGTSATI